MGVSLCSPSPGLEGGRVTGQQTQPVGPAQQHEPSCSWTGDGAAPICPGAEQSEGQGRKGSLCSLLLPPALCLWENWAL